QVAGVAQFTLAVQVLLVVTGVPVWSLMQVLSPVAIALPTTVTVRFSPAGQEARTQPMAAAVWAVPAPTVSGVGPSDTVLSLQSTRPGTVMVTLSSIVLVLCTVTETVIGAFC